MAKQPIRPEHSKSPLPTGQENRRSRSLPPQPKGIPEGPGFSGIRVDGQDDVDAEERQDDLTLIAGTDIEIETDSDGTSVEIRCTPTIPTTGLSQLDEVNIGPAPIDGDHLIHNGVEWVNETPTPPTVPTVVGDLDDVNPATPTNGDVLEWDTDEWVPTTPTPPVIPDLDELGDVTVTGPSVGDIIEWDGAGWVNATPSGGTIPSALDDLTDVVITTPATDGRLAFDGADWVDAPALDPDDLDDSGTANKFTNAADILKLADIETDATADQTKADIDGLGLDHDQLDNIGTNSHADVDSHIADSTLHTPIVDEDDMVSDSAVLVPSQQSVKAYVDAVSVPTSLDDLGDTIVTSPSLDQRLAFNGSRWVNEDALDPDDLDDTSTTNKFTTAGDISKLAGVETAATADQTKADIDALGLDHTQLDNIGTNSHADVDTHIADTAQHFPLIDEDTLVSDLATSAPSQQSVKAYVDAEVLILEGVDAGQTAYVVSTVAPHIADATKHFPLIDEDTMVSDLATSAPSQQSVKAYVDTEITGIPTPTLATTDLTDVSASGASNGWRLIWSSSSSEWVPTPPRADINLGSTPDGNDVVVDTDGSGTDATILAATTSLAGVMTASDKTKLDSIEPRNVFYCRKGSAQATTTSLAALTTWATPARIDSAYSFDSTTGEVTFLTDWEGFLNCHMYADGTANDRCFLFMGLQQDVGAGFVDVGVSKAANYSSRTTTLDEGGVSISGLWRSYVSGDKLRWVIKHTQSGADVSGFWSMDKTL